MVCLLTSYIPFDSFMSYQWAYDGHTVNRPIKRETAFELE